MAKLSVREQSASPIQPDTLSLDSLTRQPAITHELSSEQLNFSAVN